MRVSIERSAVPDETRLPSVAQSSTPATGGLREIFLSYARADGRALAEDVRERLATLGHDLWQDVFDMAGGQDWWARIEERITHAVAAVLVVTPAAFKSPVVRREWLLARRVGTPCLPVTDDPNVFETAPRWLRNVDVFVLAAGHSSFELTWHRFVSQIDSPPPIRPIPFMAHGLPGEFVAGDRARSIVVELLLDASQEEPAFSTTLVEAAPGFGKTVLAQEVCHDQRMIDTFTGGILWVTLGERGQGALPGLNAVVSELSGTRVTFASVDEGEARLTELLQSRDCLLVLDDVWEHAHAKPFLAATNLTRLITTRSSQNLAIDGATVVLLDEMTRGEATQMLRNFIPSDAPAADLDIQSTLAALALRLGEWPLLLGIFGGTLRTEIILRHRTFVEAMAWIQNGLDAAGLTAFDNRRSEDRSAALAKSVEVSLQPYADDERQRLFELAVFPPGEPIHEALVLRLWTATASMTAFNVGRLLREMGGTFFRLSTDETDRSLVLRFHDALREHLAYQLAPMRARDVHRLLLGSYFGPNTSPVTAADDGYLYDHVAYHLRFGDPERLHALLRDPQWFRARFAHRDHTYDGFMADVAQGSETAFTATSSDIGAGNPPQGVAELTRYQLTRVTIEGLAGRIPSEIIVRALKLGLRTPAQAVSVVRRVPDPADRIRGLHQLLAVGSPFDTYRRDLEALAVQTAEDWLEPSVYALSDLADRLQEPARGTVLQRALRAATEVPRIRAERSRAEQALGIHGGYSAEHETAHGLAAVARRLTGEQRSAIVRDGLRIARSVSDHKERAHALAALLGLTQADERRACYDAALEAAAHIDNQQEKLFALAAIASNAGGDEQHRLLNDIWIEALTIADEPWRAFCLSRAAAQYQTMIGAGSASTSRCGVSRSTGIGRPTRSRTTGFDHRVRSLCSRRSSRGCRRRSSSPCEG